MSRLKLTANSQITEFGDTLDLDFLKTTKYLLNGVNLRFRFNRASSAFCLQKYKDDTAVNYKLKILSMKLSLRKVLPEVSILTAHERILAKTTAKYEFDRLVFRHFNIPKDSNNHTLENIFNGMLPQKIIFMLCDTEDFTGSLSTNPYNFQHKNISHVSLFVDQTPLINHNLNFSDSKYIEFFQNFYFHLGYTNPHKGNLEITRDDFKNGYTIMVYDLSTDLNAGTHLNLHRTGNLRLSLTFATTLTKPATILIIGSFSNLVQIDKDRKVFHDFKL